MTLGMCAPVDLPRDWSAATLLRENQETSTSCESECCCHTTPGTCSDCSASAVACVPEPPVPVMNGERMHHGALIPRADRELRSSLPW
eukprot:558860-Prymnesium_polylepis.1